METIRVENFRNLKDTGNIQIKPITVLVGTNSSGKSSFLRLFPLLRQSVESRSTGPILWYGPYVDFDNFKTTLMNHADPETISLHFNFSLFGEKKNRIPIKCSLSFSSKGADIDDIFTSDINLTVFDHKIEISFKPNSSVKEISINKESLIDLIKDTRVIGINNLIPRLVPTSKFDPRLFFTDVFSVGISQEYLYRFFNSVFLDNAKSLIRNNIQKIKDEKIEEFFSKWNFDTTSNMLQKFKSLPEIVETEKSLKKTLHQNDVCQLMNLLIMHYVITILLDQIENYLLNCFKAIKYIAPVRAIAERYYRIQNLAVDEVDFQGRNLARFLNNMDDEERVRFSKWTQKLFDFNLNTSPTTGHIALNISENGATKSFNLADTGFGYSQLIPILTQLWHLVDTKSKPKRKTKNELIEKIPIFFCIEQPELHLHPRLQAKIAEALVDIVRIGKDNDVDLRIIVETHSEAIINRFGELIFKRDAKENWFNIVLFNKQQGQDFTNVEVSHYTKEGYLENWPIGFFWPGEM